MRNKVITPYLSIALTDSLKPISATGDPRCRVFIKSSLRPFPIGIVHVFSLRYINTKDYARVLSYNKHRRLGATKYSVHLRVYCHQHFYWSEDPSLLLCLHSAQRIFKRTIFHQSLLISHCRRGITPRCSILIYSLVMVLQGN